MHRLRRSATVNWLSWTLALLVVPWVWTIPHLSAAHSARVWLILWSGLAVLLGAVTTPVRHTTWTGLAWLVLVGGCWEWGRWSMTALPWLWRWAGWWDTAGWWLVSLGATVAVSRHSPPLRPWLAPIFGCLLLAQVLHPFVTTQMFGAWCALSLPLLWAWTPWASVFALVGLVQAKSFSAVLAVGCWLWAVAPRARLAIIAGVLLAFRLESHVWICLSQRWETWLAVLKTIAVTPRGIGWEFGASQAVLQHTHTAILSTPNSDALLLVLRYGWWVVPAFALVSVWVWRHSDWSLRIAWILSCLQTSVSHPLVGAWVWLLVIASRQEAGHEEEAGDEDRLPEAEARPGDSRACSCPESTWLHHVGLRGD